MLRGKVAPMCPAYQRRAITEAAKAVVDQTQCDCQEQQCAMARALWLQERVLDLPQRGAPGEAAADTIEVAMGEQQAVTNDEVAIEWCCGALNRDGSLMKDH